MIATVGVPATVSWTPAGSGAQSLVVTKPDGTVLSPAPTVTDHEASFTPADPGRYLLTWTASSESLIDVLDVWPADPHYMVSLADALTAVGAGGTAPAETVNLLPLYIAAATLVVEDLAGPVVPESRTWVVDGGRAACTVPALNVTVSQVTVGGEVVDPSAYTVDSVAGIVIFASAPVSGTRNVAITYRVGGGAIGANLRLACLEQIRFLWQTARGGGEGKRQMATTPSGFAVPRHVAEMCQLTPRAPGFA